MSRILITGGTGYVGGRVAQALAGEPAHQVVLTTRSNTIQPLNWLPNADVVSLELSSDDDCRRACEGITTVIHLAALNEIDSGQDPQQALVVNGLGSLKLLQAAQRQGVQKFIYFSTAHVYCAPLIGTITEDLVPRPAHPYAISHKTAEDFVLAAGDCTSLDTLVVRLSNGFGAPTHPAVNRWTLVANDLCQQAVMTQKLTLRSAGLQQRDFITLNDVGRAIVHFLAPDMDWGNGIFNLGGGNSLRIIDIADIIQTRCKQFLGFTPEIQRPIPKASDKSEKLDYRIDKLKVTGFELTGKIEEEIDATLRLCKQAFGDSAPKI